MQTRASIREASPWRSVEGREAERLRRFDARLGELARGYATLPALDLKAALMPALEVLGSGLEADRVRFFSANLFSAMNPNSNADLFDAMGTWRSSPDGSERSESPASVDLDRFSDGGRGLRAGRAQWLPAIASDPEHAEPVGLRARRAARVRSAPVRKILHLPCLSSAGLLGFFAVEGGGSAAHWVPSIVERAELAGVHFAMVLDRYRLARELDVIRVRQGHHERLETLGRVASGVAHDFNNVLTAILGNTDLLEMELVGAGESHVELSEIRKAAARAADLVENVLSFGRPRPVGARSVDLADCVRRLRSMIERVVGDGIALELDLESISSSGSEEEVPRVRIDPGRFERVLLNLASNARAALADVDHDPRFAVSLRRVTIDAEGREVTTSGSEAVFGLSAGEHIRLTSRDNGCGMDEARIARIFEPFFTTKQACGGTGLGLSTVVEVLRECGGGIRVESAPGEGAAFHLYFSIARPEERAVESPFGLSPGWDAPLLDP